MSQATKNQGQITVVALLNANQHEQLMALARRKEISFSAQIREVIDYYLYAMEGE